MFGQRMGHSHGQPALTDVKYSAGGASTQVNGSVANCRRRQLFDLILRTEWVSGITNSVSESVF